MSLERFCLVVIYLLGAVLSWAIIRYVVFFEMGLYPEEADSFIFTRVFVCAPGLLIIGCLLLIGFKRSVHKVFGCFFIIEGTVWAGLLIQTLRAESA